MFSRRPPNGFAPPTEPPAFSRQTTWPGEDAAPPVEDIVISDRDAEFVEWVQAEVRRRQGVDPVTGEVRGR